MPDRLVDLYAQLAQKVEDLDRSLRAVIARDAPIAIAAGAAGIAKILFFIFLVAFVVSLLMGVFRRSV